MNIHSFQAMGTHFQFVGMPDPIAEEMEDWVRMVETRLSRFSPDSELQLLNQSDGKPVPCSDILWEVIELADHFYRETEGIFHPYLGYTLNRLGYDRSFERIISNHNQPIPLSLAATIPLVDHPISLNPKRKEAILDPLVSVDVGGIAKGWCAQKISERAKQSGCLCGLVDAGGDMTI